LPEKTEPAPDGDVVLLLAAEIAYGVGVNCCLGESTVTFVAPFVPTPICSQFAPPANALDPKSTVVVNNPLLTVTLVFVTGPTTATPFVGMLNKENVKVNVPFTEAPLSRKFPW
jgi:hypothetical protein